MPTTQSTLKTNTTFDAFDTKVTQADIAEFRASGGRNPGSSWIVALIMVGFLSGAFFIGFIVTVANEFFEGSISKYDLKDAAQLAYASAILGLALIPLHYLNKRFSQKGIVRSIQLKRFVEANGWKYDERPGTPERPGLLFNTGEERLGYYTVTASEGKDFSFGAYSYTTGVGRGRSTNQWGFIELPTSADLPHIVLDAKRNNGRIFGAQLFTSLPLAFDKAHKVSVSPEVDSAYVTYAFDGDAGMAADYFTPEFVEKFNGFSYNYDFEVVNGKVYAYRLRPFDPLKDDMKEVVAVIDILKNTFGNNETFTREAAPTLSETIAPKRLQGSTPKLVRVLGFVGITVQIIVAVTLLYLNQQ